MPSVAKIQMSCQPEILFPNKWLLDAYLLLITGPVIAVPDA